MHSYRDTLLQEIHRYKDPEMEPVKQGYRDTGIQGYRKTGLQGCRNTRKQD